MNKFWSFLLQLNFVFIGLSAYDYFVTGSKIALYSGMTNLVAVFAILFTVRKNNQ